MYTTSEAHQIIGAQQKQAPTCATSHGLISSAENHCGLCAPDTPHTPRPRRTAELISLHPTHPLEAIVRMLAMLAMCGRGTLAIPSPQECGRGAESVSQGCGGGTPAVCARSVGALLVLPNNCTAQGGEQ
jgi:hypothetical protein